METIEISGIIGMIALACLAANFYIGITIWSNSKLPFGIRLPYGLTLLQLHKFTGYSAAISILVHILLIPLDPLSKFTWGDLLLPAWTQHQPLANTFGAVALYLLSMVVISSYYKSKMKLAAWRVLHYLSYFAIVPLILHSIITDPKLQDRPIDWFDAEKLFVILCCLVIVVFSFYRLSLRNRMK
jgi:sulfoxide reductase heme-binding subunit YedZ